MSFALPNEALRLFIAKLKARSPLGSDEEATLLGLPAAPRRFAAHREIVGLGQTVEQSCLVAEGLVARYAQTEDGRRQLISLHLPGDMVDLYSLMLPASGSALVAVTATTVFQIPRAALRTPAFRQPMLAAALWRDCVVDGAIIAQWLINIGRKTARARLAHLICEMDARYGFIGQASGDSVPFLITQEQLGDALGLTSVHVNRSLRALREDGLVEATRTHVTILNRALLASEAEFDRSYLHLPAGRAGARTMSV